MADFQAWQPPPSQSPVQTLSGVMNIQNQRQQLLLQQQELQRSQVQTSQDLGVNQFFSEWDPGQHHGDDGTLDIDSAHQSDAYQNLPGVARVAVDTKLNQLKGQQLQNKQQLSTLNGQVVDQFGKLAQALSTNPDPDDVKAQLTAFAKQGPDQARIAGIYGPILQKVPPERMGSALKTMGAQAQDVSAQQQQTNPAQLAVNTGGETQLYNVNKATGLQPGQQPIASIRNTLGPAQQIPYLGAAAAASGAGSAAGAGSANIDVDRAKQVGDLQQQSAAAIQLSRQADALKDALDSGTLAKKISETGNWLGFSSVNEARAQLIQDLGKMKGLVADRAGSDARANTILEGYPSDTTPNNTFHADMDYIRGTGRQNLARGQLLSQYQNPKDPNAIRGFAAADNMLTGSTNPLMHEFLALKPSERAGFYTRNFSTPQQAQAFKDQVTALQRHSSVVSGQ
jgi:hypothetical protein